jgi:hypothetical protein
LATDPTSGSVSTLTKGAFVYNTTTGTSFFVDQEGFTRVIEKAATATAAETDYWVETTDYHYTLSNTVIGENYNPSASPSLIPITGGVTPQLVVKDSDAAIINGRLHVYNNDWNGICIYNDLLTPSIPDYSYPSSAEMVFYKTAEFTGTIGIDHLDTDGTGNGVRHMFIRYKGLDTITIDDQWRTTVGGTNPAGTYWAGFGPYTRVGGVGSFAVRSTAYRQDNATTWDTVSDMRVKENIEIANLDLCYQNVKTLKLKFFKWSDKYMPGIVDKHVLGWIAQDVRAVMPKATNESKFGDIDDLLSINATQIYAMLYGAVQKIQEKLEISEDKEAERTAKIEALEADAVSMRQLIQAQSAIITDLTTRLTAVEARP